jgi:hypothetical protein
VFPGKGGGRAIVHVVEVWSDLPIPEEDAAWDLGNGIRVEAALQQREVYPDVHQPAPPEIIYQAWPAAQVAATSITLAQAVALAMRRWRKKEPALPPGTRLALEVELPDEGNQLRPVTGPAICNAALQGNRYRIPDVVRSGPSTRSRSTSIRAWRRRRG